MLRIRVGKRVSRGTRYDYPISTSKEGDDRIFKVLHTYTDFEKLHRELHRDTTVPGLAECSKFPVPKLAIHTSEALDERTQQLGFYLASVAALCHTANTSPAALLEFLSVDSDEDLPPPPYAADLAMPAPPSPSNAAWDNNVDTQRRRQRASGRLGRAYRRVRLRRILAWQQSATADESLAGWLRKLDLSMPVLAALAPALPSDAPSSAILALHTLRQGQVREMLAAADLGGLSRTVWESVATLQKQHTASGSEHGP